MKTPKRLPIKKSKCKKIIDQDFEHPKYFCNFEELPKESTVLYGANERLIIDYPKGY